MACNCSGKSSSSVEYRVTLNSGTVKTVSTITEVRIALATGGGGSYKAVPKTDPKAA